MKSFSLQFLDKKMAQRYEILFFSAKRKVYGASLALFGLFGIVFLII